MNTSQVLVGSSSQTNYQQTREGLLVKYKREAKGMNNLINNNAAYSDWLEQLSQQYQRSQIKAAVSVNREMLSLTVPLLL